MSKEKALVIVEDKGTRNAIKILLELSGIEVASTDNAMLAKKSAQKEAYDIFLTDLNIASPAGENLLFHFKSTPETYRTPYIVLSTSDDESDLRKCMNSGAADYIKVPFSGKLLSTTVKAQLAHSKKQNALFRREIADQVFSLVNKNFNQELLTPIYGILNVTSLICGLPGVEAIDGLPDLLEVIYGSSFRMQRNTLNLRTYSLLQTEDNEQNFTGSGNIILQDVLKAVVRHYETELSNTEKKVELSILQVGTWEGKEEFIRIIFTELIDNAIKFSSGSLLPVVKLQALNNSFTFSVTNYLKDNVYFNIGQISPFRKFHNDMSRNGLGLGLFIVKAICEKMGFNFFMTKDNVSVTMTIEAAKITTFEP